MHNGKQCDGDSETAHGRFSSIVKMRNDYQKLHIVQSNRPYRQYFGWLYNILKIWELPVNTKPCKLLNLTRLLGEHDRSIVISLLSMDYTKDRLRLKIIDL